MSERVVLRAVIPTGQYANLQPEIEVVADSYEDALQLAESRLVEIWNKYVEPGKELLTVNSPNRVKLRAFVGGDYWYDSERHEYSNEAGEVYLSSSVYAQSLEPLFDKQMIAGVMAKKSHANPNEIIKMWELNAEASTCFGDSIHKAMQLFETYRNLAIKLEKESHISSNFFLKDVVLAFYKTHKQQAFSEKVAIDHVGKRATTIDRLEVIGERRGRITDFKTGEITDKKLKKYFNQVKFSTEIMEVAGWKMEKPIIYGWNGGWSDYHE